MTDNKIDMKFLNKISYSYKVYEVDGRKFFEWHYLDESRNEVDYSDAIEIDSFEKNYLRGIVKGLSLWMEENIDGHK
jgi:hypothetical protein